MRVANPKGRNNEIRWLCSRGGKMWTGQFDSAPHRFSREGPLSFPYRLLVSAHFLFLLVRPQISKLLIDVRSVGAVVVMF